MCVFFVSRVVVAVIVGMNKRRPNAITNTDSKHNTCVAVVWCVVLFALCLFVLVGGCLCVCYVCSCCDCGVAVVVDHVVVESCKNITQKSNANINMQSCHVNRCCLFSAFVCFRSVIVCAVCCLCCCSLLLPSGCRKCGCC